MTHRRAAILLLTLLSITGCFPLMNHGAAVSPGVTLGMASGLGWMVRDSTSARPAYVQPTMDLGFYLAGTHRPEGWRQGGTRFALSLGLASLLSADLYTEFPRAVLPTTSASGVGLTYQPGLRNLVVGYTMQGWRLEDGSMFHVTVGGANTQGLARNETTRHWLGIIGIGYQPMPKPGAMARDFTLHLTYILGTQGRDCTSDYFCAGGTPRVVLGMSGTLPRFARRCRPLPGEPGGRCPDGRPPGFPPPRR